MECKPADDAYTWFLSIAFYYAPAQRSWRGYTGFAVSICPSVRLWTESCSLCIFHNTRRIHFIFTHLFKQLQKVFGVYSFYKIKNLKFCQILYICNFDFVPFWLGIQYDSIVWVIMRRRGISSERRRSSCSSYDRWKTMRCLNNAVNFLLTMSTFSSQWAPHSSSTRERYGVSFVNSKTDLCYASLIAVMHVISWYIDNCGYIYIQVYQPNPMSLIRFRSAGHVNERLLNELILNSFLVYTALHESERNN